MRRTLLLTGVSNEKLLASLKELGFECRLRMARDPKLDVNIISLQEL